MATRTPRKTTAATAKKTPPPMQKLVNKQPAPPETKTLPYLGRDFEVKLPNAMQVMGWQHVMQRLQNVGDMDGEQAMELLGKAKKILKSVLVHEADLDWLMDKALEGELEEEELLGIVPAAIQEFADDVPTNRAARRKGPGPRARLAK